MLITMFDTCLTISGSLGLSQDPFNSECSPLTHFTISLAQKYLSIKEPYNQGIKEQVTIKIFWEKNSLYMKSPIQET